MHFRSASSRPGWSSTSSPAAGSTAALYLSGECAPELLDACGRCAGTAPAAPSLSVAFVTFPGVDVLLDEIGAAAPRALATPDHQQL